MKPNISATSTASRIARIGEVFERPLPNIASTGEAVSPSDGMTSQAAR
jgi:hypothetical protein